MCHTLFMLCDWYEMMYTSNAFSNKLRPGKHNLDNYGHKQGMDCFVVYVKKLNSIPYELKILVKLYTSVCMSPLEERTVKCFDESYPHGFLIVVFIHHHHFSFYSIQEYFVVVEQRRI